MAATHHDDVDGVFYTDADDELCERGLESDPKSCDARLSLPAVGVDGEVSLHPRRFIAY